METANPSVLPHVADLLLDAIFLVDPHGRIVYASAACERILGYAPHELVGKQMIDYVLPEDRAKTWEESMQVMAGHPRIGFENRYVRKDGTVAHIMWSARWSQADQLRIGVARDVTERKHAEERQAATYAIAESAHSATDLAMLFARVHRIIADLVPVAGFAVATRDAEAKRLSFPYQADLRGNQQLEESLAGRYVEEVIQEGKPLLRVSEAATSSGVTSWLAVPLATQNHTLGALLLKSPPGTIYSSKEMDLLQFVSAQVATAMERSMLHAELMHAARYDELTGLPNRRLFQDRMRSALARCRRNQTKAAVLYVDIDDFKQVNDAFGHIAGDALLQEFARRLAGCVREEDTVARLGGDEFVVLVEKLPGRDEVLAIAAKIHAATSQPMAIAGNTLQPAASIGAALYPDDGTEEEALLMHADKAMYREKQGKASPPS